MVEFCDKCGNLMRKRSCPCQDEEMEPIDLIPKLISGEIRLEINGKTVKVHPDVIKKYTKPKQTNKDFDIDKFYSKALREYNDIIGGKKNG